MDAPAPPRPSRARATALAAAIAVAASGVTIASGFAAAPLPPAPPFTGELPPAAPPAGMTVRRLDTGVTHRTAAFAYRGGSFRDARDFTVTAVLVHHPGGDLLIDAGFARTIDAQFASMPLYFRLVTRYTRLVPAAEQLDRARHDRRHLRGILLTHAHWDHASGLADFPGVPVLLPAEERRYLQEGGELTAVARSAPGLVVEEYAFEGGPYLGFPRSHDVFGDGSVVVVPAPGHTPGSVIVFLALPGGARHALVGDLAWQREGILEREERPLPMRALADVDPTQVREHLVHMSSIASRFPQMSIIPAHDARAFESIPPLGDGPSAPDTPE